MAKIPNGGGSSPKVKLMCSYGGRIQPRPQDQQLSYVGGDTKILTVDRRIKLHDIVEKLRSLCCFDSDGICIKYQLPGEDLDVLISLINEDDLENMMIEYDRLLKKISPDKPARFRLFLSSFDTIEKSKEQNLNSGSDAAGNPDYLFGFDKDYDYAVANNTTNNTASTKPGFDLGLWTIPKTAITGNDCSVNLNESEKQESRDAHVTNVQCGRASPVAMVYNMPVPVPANGGYQTGGHYGMGRYVPVSGVNGYRDQQPVYFIAPASVHSAEQRFPAVACSDGKVVNNQVRNV